MEEKLYDRELTDDDNDGPNSGVNLLGTLRNMIEQSEINSNRGNFDLDDFIIDWIHRKYGLYRL